VACIKEMRNQSKFSRENLKKPLGRSRYRCEDTIKMDLKKLWKGMDCMNLVQNRDMWQARLNTVMNLHVP